MDYERQSLDLAGENEDLKARLAYWTRAYIRAKAAPDPLSGKASVNYGRWIIEHAESATPDFPKLAKRFVAETMSKRKACDVELTLRRVWRLIQRGRLKI